MNSVAKAKARPTAKVPASDSERRPGWSDQYGYPRHDIDSGPLLPTTDGGLICSRCHKVWATPDGIQYRLAVIVHRDAGEKPIDTRRPQPKGPADLTPKERAALLSVQKGSGHRLAQETAAPLVLLGLVTEKKEIGRGKGGAPEMKVTARTLTETGEALARMCAEAATPPANGTLFDLGAADPEALRRKEDAKVEAARRRMEKVKR